VPPFAFQRRKRRGIDRLDLRDDDIGFVLRDRGAERLAVKHRKHFARVRDLHRRSVGVAVAGDHSAAEPFGGNGELTAELARAQ